MIFLLAIGGLFLMETFDFETLNSSDVSGDNTIADGGNTDSGEGNASAGANDLIRQSPFGPLLDLPGVDGPEDIFGNVGIPDSSEGNPFEGGGGDNPVAGGGDLPYGGNPFAGDNFWNIFAGGVNPADTSSFGGSSNSPNGSNDSSGGGDNPFPGGSNPFAGGSNPLVGSGNPFADDNGNASNQDENDDLLNGGLSQRLEGDTGNNQLYAGINSLIDQIRNDFLEISSGWNFDQQTFTQGIGTSDSNALNNTFNADQLLPFPTGNEVVSQK